MQSRPLAVLAWKSLFRDLCRDRWEVSPHRTHQVAEVVMWLFVLLLVVPIIEIALFIEVGGWLGLWPTLVIVTATALAGTLLLRSQGTATVRELQSSVSTGRNPLTLIAHGALILAAGIFLMTPGFFTDAVGLSLLIPPVRATIIAWASKRMTVHSNINVDGKTYTSANASRDDTIDGDYSVVSGDGEVVEDATFSRDDSAPKGTSRWTKPPE